MRRQAFKSNKSAKAHKTGRPIDPFLNGLPGSASARRALAALTQRLKSDHARRAADFAAGSAALAAARAPLLAPLAEDAGVGKAVARLRERAKALGKREVRPPRFPRFDVQPGVSSGSILTVRVPPYDVPFSATVGTPSGATSNPGAGTFGFSISGGGGSTAAGAGLGIWFRSLTRTASTRVGVLTDYGYDWFDISAGGYTAHNRAGTHVWVWGDVEHAWVTQTPESPGWTDGTGWYEEHQDQGEGRLADQAFFPTRADAWYLAFIFANGSVDDSSGGFLGFSWAQSRMSFSVPLVVFEQ